MDRPNQPKTRPIHCGLFRRFRVGARLLARDLPKEKLIDYAMQLVVARNIKSGLHSIESSVDYS